MKTIREQQEAGIILATCILLALVIILFCSKSNASEIPEQVAVRVLIGEAANQGEHGMICVAEVLRRRGSIKGFYGATSKIIDKQPAWVWRQARTAWRKSAHTNYTHSATLFENTRTFGCPYWIKNCVETYTYREHRFFKEVRYAKKH